MPFTRLYCLFCSSFFYCSISGVYAGPAVSWFHAGLIKVRKTGGKLFPRSPTPQRLPGISWVFRNWCSIFTPCSPCLLSRSVKENHELLAGINSAIASVLKKNEKAFERDFNQYFKRTHWITNPFTKGSKFQLSSHFCSFLWSLPRHCRPD